MIKTAFKLGFLKEAQQSDISIPLTVEFIEKVVKLPPEQRKKAIQKRLQQWNQDVFNAMQNNIQQAVLNIKNEKIEDVKKKKEKKKEKSPLGG